MMHYNLLLHINLWREKLYDVPTANSLSTTAAYWHCPLFTTNSLSITAAYWLCSLFTTSPLSTTAAY
jgi:hypothetical protein